LRALAGPTTLALAVAIAACSSIPAIPDISVLVPFVGGRSDEPAAGTAMIAPDVAITLPVPPGYPDTAVASQVVRARRGERTETFEAIVSLSPERVEVVVTAPAGPRLATIVWTAEGIAESRTPLAPEGIGGTNVLADLFLTRWPAPAVAAALPKGVSVRDDLAGRTIESSQGTLVEVRQDAQNPRRVLLHNRALGYDLSIVSRDLE
jgi:hypothetical protein